MTSAPRSLPPCLDDRLIVALDLPTAEAARAMAAQLDGVATFFKLGWRLILAPGFDRLLDDLVAQGKQIFLDGKIYDIGETVKDGVAQAARRGVSLLTVHGDDDIIRAAVEGRGESGLRLLAITVLTSVDDAGVEQLGYRWPVAELIRRRVGTCFRLGCDGIIASPADVTAIRALSDAERLLVVTPGVRLSGGSRDDHKRSGTPAEAIAAGADYLVVGRPILQAPDPAAMAARIIADMKRGAAHPPP